MAEKSNSLVQVGMTKKLHFALYAVQRVHVMSRVAASIFFSVSVQRITCVFKKRTFLLCSSWRGYYCRGSIPGLVKLMQ